MRTYLVATHTKQPVLCGVYFVLFFSYTKIEYLGGAIKENSEAISAIEKLLSFSGWFLSQMMNPYYYSERNQSSPK